MEPNSNADSASPRVGVLVDLALTPTAGGQQRFWHNIARAAAAHGTDFDLTIHFQGLPGEPVARTPLADNVRLVTLPPVLSTRRLKYLSHSPDHADLAPYHPRLARELESYDVVHTTDAYFAYAKTALRVVARSTNAARPHVLTSSIHTETPAYTRLYAEQTFGRMFGEGWLGKQVIERWRWPAIAERRMRTALSHHLQHCDHVWFAPSDARDGTTDRLDEAGGFGLLPRGVDATIFSPDRRDRARLDAQFGFAPDDFVLAFAGRIDVGKDVMVAAEAARLLLDRGHSVKLILAGLGRDAERIAKLLGPAARLPGFLDQAELGWILASSDAFVFPSRIETAANAIIEARACGLPTLASREVGSMLIRESGVDGLVQATRDPATWADAIEALVCDRDRARKMGALASALTAETQPSWHEVLRKHLEPGWKRALATRRAAAEPS